MVSYHGQFSKIINSIKFTMLTISDTRVTVRDKLVKPFYIFIIILSLFCF